MYVCVYVCLYLCAYVFVFGIFVQVYLQASHREVVGIVELRIEPCPQRVDQVFHFYHPERTFLKKAIEVDTEHPLFLHHVGPQVSTEEQSRLYVCASDPEVTCDVRSTVSVICLFMVMMTQNSSE